MLSSKLIERLRELKFPEADQLRPEELEWAFHDDDVAPFCKWFMTNINHDNFLSKDELHRFKTMKENNDAILDLDELLDSLSVSTAEENELLILDSEEALKEEIKKAEEELHQLKQYNDQTRIRVNLLNKFSQEIAQKESIQDHYEKSMNRASRSTNEKLSNLNFQLNDQLHTVQQCLDKLSSSLDLYRSQSFGRMSLQKYFEQEEDYSTCCSSYVKKLFFKGLTDIVADGEVEDVPKTYAEAMKEASDELWMEFQRLMVVYPDMLRSDINSKLRLEGSRVMLKEARNMLQLVIDDEMVLDAESLSEEFKTTEMKNQELLARNQQHREQVLKLIAARAEMKPYMPMQNHIFLKRKRQSYFLAQQNRTVEVLLDQRARFELLSCAMNIELRHYQNVHEIVSQLLARVDSMVRSCEFSIKLMADKKYQISCHKKETVSGQDRTIHGLAEICDGGNERKKVYLTFDDVAKRLVKEKETLSSALVKREIEEQHGVEKTVELENVMHEVELWLFGKKVNGSTSVPEITWTPATLKDALLGLERKAKDLEENLAEIMTDLSERNKQLKNDPLRAAERNLFVYFMTQPEKLRQIVEQVERTADL